MKELSKRKLFLRNWIRTFGIFLSMMFLFDIFVFTALFILKTLEGTWVDLIYSFIVFLGFSYTFINILPDDYLITYKKYLKSFEKKK